MPENITPIVPPHEETRKQIARFLPDALAKALTSYHEFMDVDIPKGKPKTDEAEGQTSASAFERHHKACKAAIAHIELLIKLAEWAQLPDVKADDHNQQIVLSALLQEANAEIKDSNARDQPNTTMEDAKEDDDE